MKSNFQKSEISQSNKNLICTQCLKLQLIKFLMIIRNNIEYFIHFNPGMFCLFEWGKIIIWDLEQNLSVNKSHLELIWFVFDHHVRLLLDKIFVKWTWCIELVQLKNLKLIFHVRIHSDYDRLRRISRRQFSYKDRKI